MSTQSNAIPETRVGAVAVAPLAISPMRLLYWSVRRELWEYRSIFLAPLATAGIFFIGFLITAPQLVGTMRKASAMAGMQMHDALAKPYDMASGFLMAIAMFVGAAYCLGALYNERRDRSILFWKSLPVSDATAVLAKACIPLVILPLVTVAVTVALHFVMLLIHSAVLAATGQSVAMLWAQILPIQMWFMLLYHLIAVHSLWHSPFYGWMLLVSSWAKRAAFLWAALPVLAIGALERLLFNSSHFFQMLGYRLSGDEAAVAPAKDWPINPMTHITPGHFLLSSGLWTGLIFTALCLAGAVRMRRYRSPL
jgi:ABC-2 type transport system permease protein